MSKNYLQSEGKSHYGYLGPEKYQDPGSREIFDPGVAAKRGVAKPARNAPTRKMQTGGNGNPDVGGR
jgi:hypothetical protein